MPSNKKTFWPYGILLSIFAIVIACIVTIIFASNYPVYEDDSYLEKYQNVDKNINQIQKQQKNFDDNFIVKLNINNKKNKKGKIIYNIKQDQKYINILIEEKTNLNAFDIKSISKLTRPHTNTQDKILENKIEKNTNNTYILKIKIPQLEHGRWQIKTKLKKNKDTIGFFSFDLLVQ